MTGVRNIGKVFKSKSVIEGAGVHLKRAFGFSEVPSFDPFLLLDDFRSNDPQYYIKGFPWHPHRGIETITYMLHGRVEHGDSLGNNGTINAGDVQWMTAGNGIIHQEMPKGGSQGEMGGFQLWANLPATDKMMEPRYREIHTSEIPEVILSNNIRIKVICGNVDGAKGPVQDIVIDPEYLDITVPPDSKYEHPTKPGHTVFAYVFEGAGYFCKEKKSFSFEAEGINYFDMQTDPLVNNETLVLFEDGEKVYIETEGQSMRFLLVSGMPIGETIAWHGPIVMNTPEELRVAFEEYRKGSFLKHKRG